MREPIKRKFPPPWNVEPISGGFVVKDSTGVPLTYIYADTGKMVSASYAHEKLTVDEAFLIARWISRLPKLISESKLLITSNRDL